MLHVGFERVLIGVEARSDIVFDLLQAALEVDGRLLIAWRRLLQIGKRALEGDRGIVIVNEPEGDSLVERNTGETLEGK